MRNKPTRRRTENLLGTSPFLFYFLSFTVGLPTTLGGCILALIMLITGHKPERFCRAVCFRTNGNSGMSLGVFIFVGKRCREELLIHEFGHSVQNCLYGPLMPFVVNIPSFTRFHYRRFKTKFLHKRLLTGYEDIWFEAEASALGRDYIKRLNAKARAVCDDNKNAQI
ncbi:MAG: hypothetical protein IKK83_05015 [Clostridia bacterium]|nr:hypothetical protein [Clostridia bacterium]